VTDVLRKMGYDGIRDRGGEGGGFGHTLNPVERIWL
jgi:hypothetical protein